MQIVPGSHAALVNPEHGSGFLTGEQTENLLEDHDPVPLELAAGEVVSYTIGCCTARTSTGRQARRAFSVCYMDAQTVAHNGHNYPVVFGEGALSGS